MRLGQFVATGGGMSGMSVVLGIVGVVVAVVVIAALAKLITKSIQDNMGADSWEEKQKKEQEATDRWVQEQIILRHLDTTGGQQKENEQPSEDRGDLQ